MNAHKPWEPHMRGNPIFNPFEPSTDWTRDIGANDRVDVPDQEEEEARSPREDAVKRGGKSASK